MEAKKAGVCLEHVPGNPEVKFKKQSIYLTAGNEFQLRGDDYLRRAQTGVNISEDKIW